MFAIPTYSSINNLTKTEFITLEMAISKLKEKQFTLWTTKVF